MDKTLGYVLKLQFRCLVLGFDIEIGFFMCFFGELVLESELFTQVLKNCMVLELELFKRGLKNCYWNGLLNVQRIGIVISIGIASSMFQFFPTLATSTNRVGDLD